MKFQDKLRDLRQRSNLSQAELGKMIGVSDRTIQNYENSRRTPQTYDIIYKLAGALGVKVEELVSEEDIPQRRLLGVKADQQKVRAEEISEVIFGVAA